MCVIIVVVEQALQFLLSRVLQTGRRRLQMCVEQQDLACSLTSPALPIIMQNITYRLETRTWWLSVPMECGISQLSRRLAQTQQQTAASRSNGAFPLLLLLRAAIGAAALALPIACACMCGVRCLLPCRRMSVSGRPRSPLGPWHLLLLPICHLALACLHRGLVLGCLTAAPGSCCSAAAIFYLLGLSPRARGFPGRQELAQRRRLQACGIGTKWLATAAKPGEEKAYVCTSDK